jgi:hypothetical protein
MSNMNGSICIRKGSSNQNAVVFFHNLMADCKNTLKRHKAHRHQKLLAKVAEA